jgi:phenol 2-monooxygenase (NADPH)
MRNSSSTYDWIRRTCRIDPTFLCRAFQTFGGFTSGIGVHYEESIIVNAKHQNIATHLIVGERVTPQYILRAADGRPFQIQDLLPSDTRFKLLVFTGNTSEPSQLTKLQTLAEELQAPESFLIKFSPEGKVETKFDIISISSAKKESVVYNALPQLFRSHWSK